VVKKLVGVRMLTFPSRADVDVEPRGLTIVGLLNNPFAGEEKFVPIPARGIWKLDPRNGVEEVPPKAQRKSGEVEVTGFQRIPQRPV
jgi:hypothetical protein